MIYFEDGSLPLLTDEAVSQARGFIRRKRDGRLQLILTQRQLSRMVAMPNAFLREPDIGKVLEKDGKKRRGTKRRVSQLGKQIRVYCFRLPSDFI